MKNNSLSKEDLGVKDFSTLKDSSIVNAVAEFVKQLDLGSGSSNTIQLYDLLKIYLKNIDSRNKINEILINTKDIQGKININSERKSIESWSESIKMFNDEFDKRFCPAVIDNDNLLRDKSELKEYLDRLYYLHSMMVNDLL